MTVVADVELPGPGIGPVFGMFPEYLIGEHYVSSTAHSSLQLYSEATGDQRIYEHSLRVADILHDFMGGELSKDVYDAAALHDVAQRYTAGGLQAVPAEDALRMYSEGVEGEYVESDLVFRYTKWEYMSALLADMDKIEECSELGRKVVDSLDPDKADSLAPQSEVLPQGETVVPQEAWSAKGGLVDLNKIEKLLKEVNLESALVKAAEMLDNLKHPAPHARAVLQDVIDAESFYAPLCEAMGFDGLCMALRSEAAKTRLSRGGLESKVEEAEHMLEGLNDREQVLSYVNGLFRHLLDGETEVRTPLRDASGHGIMLGNVVLHSLGITESDNKPWAHWRVKSLGSLALKLLKTNEKPVDVLGMTIVVNNRDELALTYKGLIECIRANRVVEERPSGSRAQAYSVQGSEGYLVTVMRDALGCSKAEIAAAKDSLLDKGSINYDGVELVLKDNGHQVSKATFMYRPHMADTSQAEAEIPIELQIQTKRDWLVSRIGRAAHLLYKAETGGDHKVLRSINKRREHLGSPSLNPQSLGRGKQFRDSLELAA